MEKYEIKINIEFNARDFLQAKKVRGKIEESVMPIFFSKEDMHSWGIILQRMEKERL